MPKVDEGGVAEQAASSQEAEEVESFIGEGCVVGTKVENQTVTSASIVARGLSVCRENLTRSWQGPRLIAFRTSGASQCRKAFMGCRQYRPATATVRTWCLRRRSNAVVVEENQGGGRW